MSLFRSWWFKGKPVKHYKVKLLSRVQFLKSEQQFTFNLYFSYMTDAYIFIFITVEHPLYTDFQEFLWFAFCFALFFAIFLFLCVCWLFKQRFVCWFDYIYLWICVQTYLNVCTDHACRSLMRPEKGIKPALDLVW